MTAKVRQSVGHAAMDAPCRPRVPTRRFCHFVSGTRVPPVRFSPPACPPSLPALMAASLENTANHETPFSRLSPSNSRPFKVIQACSNLFKARKFWGIMSTPNPTRSQRIMPNPGSTYPTIINPLIQSASPCPTAGLVKVSQGWSRLVKVKNLFAAQ